MANLRRGRLCFRRALRDNLQESDELYLLSVHSDASVKVRAELMDVKRLEHVSDEGLDNGCR